jgi:tRNA U55 pseudouridine synthase TruB
LRRISVGHLTVGNAHDTQDLLPETLHNHIIPPLDMIAHLPAVAISEETGRDLVCHGRPIERCRVAGSYRVMSGGELLAVYKDDEDVGRAEVVLCAK